MIPTFTCPKCGLTSAHPDDVREGYCGNCHDWTGRLKPEGAMQITTEEEALAAAEAILEWARAEPETHHGGSTTGITYQRGRIVATRVMPDHTIGLSTYETVEDAREKAVEMEKGYRNWLALRDAKGVSTVVIRSSRESS